VIPSSSGGAGVTRPPEAGGTLATYLYLCDHESEPTTTVVAGLRRLFAESGLWGDEDPETTAVAERSDEELAAVIRRLPSASAASRAPTIPMPILDGVLASPPEGWDVDLLRRLSWLYYSLHKSSGGSRLQPWRSATPWLA
jgi:hypothetical protein